MAEYKRTITTGGTAQQLLARSSSRDGFWFQNNSSGSMSISFEGEADADGPLIVPAGAYFSTPPGQSVSGRATVWGATTGQKFSLGVW